MKGFKNIGNSCYLNSGLQMLIQNKSLCKIILDNSSKTPILNILGQLIKDYWTNSSSYAIDPYTIKKIVGERKKIFDGFGQEDSTEFVLYLLDIIDEEIKKTEPNSKGLEPIFGIKFNLRIKCKLLGCLKTYNREEFNNFLLLDIDPNSKTLDDIYRKFKSSTKLDKDNKYYCQACDAKRIASSQTEIKHWPPHLFIWLKRFVQTLNKFSKNTQSIDIPLQWRHSMQLSGAIIHSGNLNGGHYMYVGRKHKTWYLFNDSSVSQINSDIELKQMLSQAYWLYYQME